MEPIQDTDEIELIDVNLDADDVEDLEDVCPDGETKELNEKNTKSGKNVVKEFFSFVIVIAIAVCAALLINRFVLVNANVPTRSMAPTINADDKLLGFRLAYIFGEPKRGDVVIFTHQCSKNEEEESYIKRIIGVPGDTIVITDGVLYINGKEYKENYLAEGMIGSFGPYEVPEDSYFMMGDNRNISEDSRYWDNTYVDGDDIVAKAFLKYDPSFKAIK